jgi:endonuclease G
MFRKQQHRRAKPRMSIMSLVTMGMMGTLWLIFSSNGQSIRGGGKPDQGSENQTQQGEVGSGNRTANQKYWTGLPQPTNNQKLVVLNRTGHSNGFDTKTGNPAWTSYVAYKQTNPSSQERPSDFEVDPDLDRRFQVRPSDYTRTGYDRGHMAPNWAISVNYGRTAQVETFYMSNIVPQEPALNRGIWASLEKITADDYARRYGEVIVFVGPIYTPNADGSQSPTLGNSRVRIPTGFYKIIVRNKQKPDALAFILPQATTAKNRDDLNGHLVPIDNIERMTHLDFLPDLSKAEQERIESQAAKRMW